MHGQRLLLLLIHRSRWKVWWLAFVQLALAFWVRLERLELELGLLRL
jgi:hypothetical protein